MNSKSIKWPLLLLLATRLAVGITYAVINPPWEAYDETGHFQYVRYLAKHQTLTLLPGDPEADVIWSKFQPPLYYALLAPFLSGFDFGPAFIYPEQNPFFTNGNAGLNYALHPPQPIGLEATQITALYVARLLGVLISPLGVLAVFASARLMWPGQNKYVWAATLLYAFWPQMLFVGSMTTNDLLVTSLATVQVYLAIRLLKHKNSIWPFIALSLVLVAGLLTKLNALALVPITLLTFLLTPNYGPRIKAGLFAVGLGLMLVAFWGLASMQFVTEQVFQLETVKRLASSLQSGNLNVSKDSPWWEYGFRTLVASYGWGNVESFNWFYPLWAGVMLLGLAGFLWRFPKMRRGQKKLWLVLVTVPVSVVGLSFALAIAQQDPFLLVGRYWLPALSVLVLVLVEGWQLIPSRWANSLVWKTLSVGVVVLGWITPATVIAPMYAYPPAFRTSETAHLARFGNRIDLVQIENPPASVAGEWAHTRLCWRAHQPVTQNLALRLEVQGPDGQGYGRINLITGNGNYPPKFWPVGAIFCETYRLQVQGNFPAPALGYITVQWLELATEHPLEVVSHNSETPTPFKVPLVVRRSSFTSPEPATVWRPVQYRLGESIQLNGYAVFPLPNNIGWRVVLDWEALGPITEEAVVFVHLRQSPTQVFIQNDGQPRGNTYPTTAWAVGEHVRDEHTLLLPNGVPPDKLLLYVGAYYINDPSTRLLVLDASGLNIQNDEIQLPFP